MVVGALPGRARGALADASALVFYASSSAKRSSVRGNLSNAGWPAGRRVVFGVFRHHARNILEMFASSRWSDEGIRRRVEVDGAEALEEALKAGAGVILVTGHIGNWELGALYLASLGHRLHVVAGVQMNTLLTGAVRDAKEARGIEVVNPSTPYRRLLRALASGGVVALLVDGDVYTGGGEILFFGKPTRAPDGPARLSRASGSPIVAGFCRRLGEDRYRIHLETIVGAREASSLSVDQALGRVYGALERYVSDNADQWCMFRPFWGRSS
jgi:Kdo2-lipid IVA lauroyltransferase/acyltransferase